MAGLHPPWPTRGHHGRPGVGKSWLTLAIAAAVTAGAPFPGQENGGEPGGVLLLTAEDGIADTVCRCLGGMGADQSRVTVLAAVRDAKGKERHPPSLVDDLTHLESTLASGGFALDYALDTHRGAALRSVLSPLAALAQR